ncbi:MAG TPA: LacI family transcriptional regulator [Methylophilaceae bacterium]|nr:LacI family transcriptional regulator [Methylophilaceae bacterium]HAJ71386.1 LacI family transcriptional regulator [Methylophilaceae bacterium]
MKTLIYQYLKILIGLCLLSSTQMSWSGELGNNCTTGLSKGVVMQTDCKVSALYNGKTYCFSGQAAKESFLADPATTVAAAETFYAKNKEVERIKITQEEALAQINSKTCDLSNKDVGYLIFNGMDLSHCNMQNISFFGAELKGANLSGANLQGAYLNLARLENANFTGANLSNAIIFQAIFSKTNFSKANLTNARMIGTLGNVDMSGANVAKGRFGLDMGNQPMGQMKFDSVGGNFAGANFEGADLNIAAFAFGDLRGTNLRNTNLYRGDLSKADLTGADLTGANLTDADVDGAIFKDVKGLASVKGWNSVKGKCVDCKIN